MKFGDVPVQESEEGYLAHSHEYQPHRAILVQTRLPSLKVSVLDRTTLVTRQRLLRHGAELVQEFRTQHAVGALVDTLQKALASDVDWLLLAGASAIADRQDVIPMAIMRLGGEVQRYGMPMDPGNLLMVGTVGKVRILGMPGCARSPRANGLDKVAGAPGLQITHTFKLVCFSRGGWFAAREP